MLQLKALLLAALLQMALASGALDVPKDLTPVMDLENTNWGFSFNINETDSSASANLQAPWASHKGKNGISVSVLTAGSAMESVQLQSQPYNLTESSYTFKFWSKAEPGANIITSIASANGTAVFSKLFTLQPVWLSLKMEFNITTTGQYRAVFSMGQTVANYMFDDFQLLSGIGFEGFETNLTVSKPYGVPIDDTPAPADENIDLETEGAKRESSVPYLVPAKVKQSTTSNDDDTGSTGLGSAISSVPLPLEAGFEDGGTSGFTVAVEKPEPSASYMYNSSMANYSGAYGMKVKVTSTSDDDQAVRVVSPDIYMTQGNTYTLSFYAKSTSPAAVPISLTNRETNSTLIADIDPKLTTKWQQVTVSNVHPVQSGPHYFVLGLGSSDATFLLDNFSITSKPDSAGEEDVENEGSTGIGGVPPSNGGDEYGKDSNSVPLSNSLNIEDDDSGPPPFVKQGTPDAMKVKLTLTKKTHLDDVNGDSTITFSG